MSSLDPWCPTFVSGYPPGCPGHSAGCEWMSSGRSGEGDVMTPRTPGDLNALGSVSPPGCPGIGPCLAISDHPGAWPGMTLGRMGVMEA